MDPLEAIGFTRFFSAQLELLGRSDLVPARVASEGQSGFTLLGCRAGLGEMSGRLRETLSRRERPVVGDWVAVEDGDERAVAHHRLDRRTALVRRAAGSAGAPQVLAANVDLFFVVTSANRDLSPRRVERYLTAVWDSGAEPVVVLNKVDLGGDVEAMLATLGEVALGVPVLAVSALSGHGMDDLRSHLGPGRTVALVGSSGVGKSSLINRLVDDSDLATRELRRDGKGRHATTRRQLVELPLGGVLVDTPGMRELGLVEDGGGVDATFTDVTAVAASCRFRDCRHQGEPGCAVESAVAEGELDRARVDSYLKLGREVAAAARLRDPTLAGRAKRRWKAIHKAYRARCKVDPKHER